MVAGEVESSCQLIVTFFFFFFFGLTLPNYRNKCGSAQPPPHINYLLPLCLPVSFFVSHSSSSLLHLHWPTLLTRRVGLCLPVSFFVSHSSSSSFIFIFAPPLLTSVLLCVSFIFHLCFIFIGQLFIPEDLTFRPV